MGHRLAESVGRGGGMGCEQQRVVKYLRTGLVVVVQLRQELDDLVLQVRRFGSSLALAPAVAKSGGRPIAAHGHLHRLA